MADVQKKEPLVASGQYRSMYEGQDKWTDKATGEERTRDFLSAIVQYLGGTHVVREPYSATPGAGRSALERAFKDIPKGSDVEVPVRLYSGRLELAAEDAQVRKVV